MPRLFYLLYRLASDLISLISRFLNAFIFGGFTSQTLSARSYLEGQQLVCYSITNRFPHILASPPTSILSLQDR
jgi:hypothetical protein